MVCHSFSVSVHLPLDSSSLKVLAGFTQSLAHNKLEIRILFGLLSRLQPEHMTSIELNMLCRLYLYNFYMGNFAIGHHKLMDTAKSEICPLRLQNHVHLLRHTASIILFNSRIRRERKWKNDIFALFFNLQLVINFAKTHCEPAGPKNGRAAPRLRLSG